MKTRDPLSLNPFRARAGISRAVIACSMFAALAAFSASPSVRAEEAPAVTRTPAENGKTLVRGRGVRALCPRGWTCKEDDEWYGLRFTSPDGKEYIMARALNFPMYDVPHYRLVMEWVRGMGARNAGYPEGTVEFTDRKGNKVIIEGHGEELPAVWMEYRDNPKAPVNPGTGMSDFHELLHDIRPDAETGARVEVPPGNPEDVYPDDVSAEGDCYRVTAEVTALRAAPSDKAKVWELLPKGGVLYQAEPAGAGKDKGRWLSAGEIDTSGDGLAYVWRMYESDKGYVRASDVRRARCTPK